MSFVLDSSVAFSWCFENERLPASLEVLELARRRAIFVPSLWHTEMANILGLAFRKKRVSEADLAISLKMLSTLEIQTDSTVQPIGLSVLLALMQAYSLTAYDAVYLELAIRLKIPLATFDIELAKAAQSAGVELVSKSMQTP